jgi:hypothetical protein
MKYITSHYKLVLIVLLLFLIKVFQIQPEVVISDIMLVLFFGFIVSAIKEFIIWILT